MTIKAAFIRILFTHCLPVNLIALGVGMGSVLLISDPLTWQNRWFSLTVLVHSIALAARVTRMGSSSTEFLYTQGYTRDQIWLHLTLSTALGAVTVWLPMALCVWLSVRCQVQDQVFLNPHFPILRQLEMAVPWFWLYGYALLLPLFHYVGMRQAQSARGGRNATAYAIGVVICAYLLMSPGRVLPTWFVNLIWLLSLVVFVAMLIAGRLLHRTVEIK